MIRRKAAFGLLIIFVCSIINPILGEDFLPSLDEALGISLPYVSKIVQNSPSQSNKTEEGSIVEEYTGISYDDYTAVGKCFKKSGFSLEKQSYSDNIIRMILQKENRTVNISYNVMEHIFKVIIPKYFTEDDECYDADNEQSVFPDIEEVVGTILPRLSAALKREPDVIRDDNGKYTEEYLGFDENDYKLFSEYLLQKGCEVKDYSKEDNILTINLIKKEDEFSLMYDPESHKATMKYDPKAILEPMVKNKPTPTPTPTRTPKPTNTPKPTQKVATIEPEYYDDFAAIYVLTLKMMAKNPDSLNVHSINIMKYKGYQYLVIEFSSKNDFGSYIRDTYSFRFEEASILSSEEDFAALDLYNKHKSDFSLVKRLNVDTVMQIVNKGLEK